VRRVVHALALGGALLLCVAASAVAQPPPRRGAAEPSGDAAAGVTPGEVQKMFDAYALMQAQEQLKIGDEQFTRFLTRFKALQDVRRQAQQERMRLLMNLRRLIAAAPPDDAQIKDRLNALQEIDSRSAAEMKKAYEAIDQILDLRQQAQFRIFEEQMERRKLELVMRARQAKRPK
jgi:Spy/CpxP family protein refolding chaperone